jgi:hypothetical protein
MGRNRLREYERCEQTSLQDYRNNNELIHFIQLGGFIGQLSCAHSASSVVGGSGEGLVGGVVLHVDGEEPADKPNGVVARTFIK